jgi:hypothetical protein
MAIRPGIRSNGDVALSIHTYTNAVHMLYITCNAVTCADIPYGIRDVRTCPHHEGNMSCHNMWCASSPTRQIPRSSGSWILTLVGHPLGHLLRGNPHSCPFKGMERVPRRALNRGKSGGRALLGFRRVARARVIRIGSRRMKSRTPRSRDPALPRPPDHLLRQGRRKGGHPKGP